MQVSLMKKGSQILIVLLLSLFLSLGSSGLVSANSSASHASLKEKRSGVYVNPSTVKESLFGTGAFILYGHHLAVWAPYWVASADLNSALCPASLPVTPIYTDLEGNFSMAIAIGTTGLCIPNRYHISVMQPMVHTLYHTSFTVRV